MARQSLTMQQNFNADELAEEKELFTHDNDYHSHDFNFDDNITNDLSDFTGWNDNDITDSN